VKCQTQGCEREAQVKGRCKPHYVAHWKAENVSIEKRDGNELYNTWCNKKKNRAPEWNSFDQFKNDVGEYRKDSRLTRLDKKLPWGPGNVEWRKIDLPKHESESWAEYNLRAVANVKLWQKYNLTPADYQQMHDEQGGVCAICKTPERDYLNGNPRKLAVDHCHTTGKVRALLCSTCNTSLGGFRDSPVLLQAAIEYLKHHSGERENESP
jgi:hypothetical protein